MPNTRTLASLTVCCRVKTSTPYRTTIVATAFTARIDGRISFHRDRRFRWPQSCPHFWRCVRTWFERGGRQTPRRQAILTYLAIGVGQVRGLWMSLHPVRRNSKQNLQQIRQAQLRVQVELRGVRMLVVVCALGSWNQMTDAYSGIVDLGGTFTFVAFQIGICTSGRPLEVHTRARTATFVIKGSKYHDNCCRPTVLS